MASIDDKFYAFENQCPHMGYLLYLGSLDVKVLTCGFHCAKFDVTTGKSFGPVTKKCLKTYRVKIIDSSVLIELLKCSKYSRGNSMVFFLKSQQFDFFGELSARINGGLNDVECFTFHVYF